MDSIIKAVQHHLKDIYQDKITILNNQLNSPLIAIISTKCYNKEIYLRQYQMLINGWISYYRIYSELWTGTDYKFYTLSKKSIGQIHVSDPELLNHIIKNINDIDNVNNGTPISTWHSGTPISTWHSYDLK